MKHILTRSQGLRAALLCIAALVGCADGADKADDDGAPVAELAAEEGGPLVREDFESGQLAAPPWTVNGDVTVRPEAARAGGQGVRLGRGASLIATLDTTGRRDITVSYDLRGLGLGFAEYASVAWALPGRSFTLLARSSSASWAAGKVVLPAAAANVAGVRVRFHVRASNLFGRERSFEGAYLDNIVISGALAGATPGCTSDAACSSLDGACTRGVCDVASGQCAAQPVDGCQACVADDDCSDDDACNGVERCRANRCTAGTAPTCNDDLPCTDDSCSPATGCQNVPKAGLPCPNGVCNASGMCEAETPRCTSDAVCASLTGPCTRGVCEASTGECKAQPVPNCKACTTADECSDGNACNGVEACQAGRCAPGTAPSCNDNKPCTTDSCSPEIGCQNVVTPGLACPNGMCNAAGMCEMQAPRCTSDASCSSLTTACARGVCNLTTGQCAAQPIPDCKACTTDTQCANSNLCDGVERCAGGRCVAGTALACADTSVCTRDSCSPQTGCVNAITPGAACPGGTCSAAGACVPSGPACSQRSTYDAIQQLIFDSTTYGCTQSFCHGAADSIVDLRAGFSYDALFSKGLVTKGNASQSVLYDVLRAKVQNMSPTLSGSAMPLGKPAITQAQLDALGAWINAGAPETGLVPGTEAGLCVP